MFSITVSHFFTEATIIILNLHIVARNFESTIVSRLIPTNFDLIATKQRSCRGIWLGWKWSCNDLKCIRVVAEAKGVSCFDSKLIWGAWNYFSSVCVGCISNLRCHFNKIIIVLLSLDQLHFNGVVDHLLASVILWCIPRERNLTCISQITISG